MVVPRFDDENSREQVCNGSTTPAGDEGAVNGSSSEVSPDHPEPYHGNETKDEMSVEPPRTPPATGTETRVVAPTESTVVNDDVSMGNMNGDGDQTDNNSDGSTDEDYYSSDDEDSDDDDYSSDSSVQTPTSVISHSLITSYRTIGFVSSDSEADVPDDTNAVEMFVMAKCLTCGRDYVVPAGAIVCTRCGYAGLQHYFF